MPDPANTAPPEEGAVFGGSCACRRITYTSSAIPESCTICHCTTCRKLSGGPYQCFPEVPATAVTFFDHKESLRYEGLPKDTIGGITFLRLSNIADRAFCVDCHTPLAMRYRKDEATTHLTLGSVDETTIKDHEVRRALEPKMHIFTSQAVWWNDFAKDGLRAHERFGGDFEQKMQVSADQKR